MNTLNNAPSDMIANSLVAFEPTHPGELIGDGLEAQHLSSAKLAESTGIRPSLLNEGINGEKEVNTELALLIEAALDIPADKLLTFQWNYDMQIAKQD